MQPTPRRGTLICVWIAVLTTALASAFSILAFTARHNADALHLQLSEAEASLAQEQAQTTPLRRALQNAMDYQGQLLEELSSLKQSEQALIQSNDTLTQEFENLAAEHELLKGTVADVSRLEERIEVLKEERNTLLQERGALRIRSERIRLNCTGSMEPTYTCLDEVTLLTNFRPEEIVEGAVIAFTPAIPGRFRDLFHRVLQVKQEDGTYYYWTKGDNAEEPDGWVPHYNIEGYVIAIHKNVRPENAELRDLVNEAYDRYRQTRAEYERLAVEFCGSLESVTTCDTSLANFRILEHAYSVHIADLCGYEYAINRATPSTSWPPIAKPLPEFCQ